MSCPKGTYVAGVLKGLQFVAAEAVKLQENQCKSAWNHSILKSSTEFANTNINEKLEQYSKIDPSELEKNVVELFEKSSMVFEGLSALLRYSKDNVSKTALEDIDIDIENDYNLYSAELLKYKPEDIVAKESFSIEFAGSPQVVSNTSQISDIRIDDVSEVIDNQSSKKQDYHAEVLKTKNVEYLRTIDSGDNKAPTARKAKTLPTLSEKAKESAVPASRIARVVSFGTLAAGLGFGTVAEMTRRTLGFAEKTSVAESLDKSFITPANAERIVNTLCKVRGAALKIGQIFSIQDSNIISPEFQKLFERVRQSADFMPTWQLEEVMVKELGADWKSKFTTFDYKPFAAASIGQVHAATLPDGREVAIKIQYPGVAKGIESDIDNLMTVMKFWNIFPKGMFIDNLVEVAKRELAWEVDYVREAECTKKFKQLLAPYPEYYIPDVIDDLCTSRVFTTELIEGISVDKCVDMDFETRCHISMLIQNLVLKEMFIFRYMQTDPNWSNFFYNPKTKQLVLLDFGASRSYDKKFMDEYLHVVKAALDGDRKKVLSHSQKMGFLTGYESKIMEDAHVDAVMILGEILRKEGFDFGAQNTIGRIQSLVPTIIHHRLCPPPEEVYSLHRKLSGAFLLYSKLKAKISAHDLFLDIYNNYEFDDT